MRTFAISDTHFNHVNILEYCRNTRPFSSLEEMNLAIINRWNSIVSQDDTVFFLGDLAMGRKEFHLQFLESLQGKIMFVPGNHDKHLVKLNKEGKLPPNVTMLPPIHNAFIEGRLFVMSHFPLEMWEGMAEHPSDGIRNAVHIHGHTHRKHGPHGKNRYDIGIDAYGQPVELTADLRFLDNPKGW